MLKGKFFFAPKIEKAHSIKLLGMRGIRDGPLHVLEEIELNVLNASNWWLVVQSAKVLSAWVGTNTEA